MTTPDAYNAKILSTLEQIQRDVADIKTRMGSAAPARSSAAGGGAVADDRDLDSQWGDPLIKKNPPKWEGEDFAGCNMSGCSPEFLESYAGFKEWSARKDDESGAVDAKGRAKGDWSRKEAARARGWAQRIRNGWKAPEKPASGGAGDYGYGGGATGTDDDVPFIFLECRWDRP